MQSPLPIISEIFSRLDSPPFQTFSCLLQNSYLLNHVSFSSLIPQFSSVAQSCPTLCDPMNPSLPDLPVHHQLLEFTQTHTHRVSDAIQPSHPLLSPSPPAPNPSQHQSLSNESTLCMRWPKYWSFSFTQLNIDDLRLSQSSAELRYPLLHQASGFDYLDSLLYS